VTAGLRLYFVSHYEPGDINRDLVVWARSPGEAIHFWRGYFALADDCEPFDLFECRHAPRAGAITWHHANGFELLKLPAIEVRDRRP
jgi:hypothetical protein